MELKNLNDDDLENEIQNAVKSERGATLKVLEYLKEIESRKIHLARGYPSLYKYVVKVLRYSEGEASRRIAAMRLLKDIPEVEEKLTTGALTLTTASQMSQFLYRENKNQKKVYTPEKKLGLVRKIAFQSSRKVDRTLANISPLSNLPKERVQALGHSQNKMTLVLNDSLLEKLEGIKCIHSHKLKSFSYEAIIEFMTDHILNTEDAKRLKFRTAPTARKETKSKIQRYIPARMRSAILHEYDHSCSYKDPKTGKACLSRLELEIDHIHPIAYGGRSEKRNLRVLCSAHNKYMAHKNR